MHLVKVIVCILIRIALQWVYNVLIDDKSTLFQDMAQHLADDEVLLESTTTQFIEAYRQTYNISPPNHKT